MRKTLLFLFIFPIFCISQTVYNPQQLYDNSGGFFDEDSIREFYLEFYNPNYRLSSFDYINYKMGVFYKILDNNDYDYGLELNCGINYAEKDITSSSRGKES